MNFAHLFDMQRQLDQFIEETQQITKDIFREKGLALIVELAELANETRCFKFWSTKGPSEKAVILEEFVDSIHFLLSLGNMKQLAINNWPQSVAKNTTLTEDFLQANHAVLAFIEQPNEQTYENVWRYYHRIATQLGFCEDEITRAYIAKNEENYERQRNGY